MPDIDVAKCRMTHYPSEVLVGRARPVDRIDGNIRRLVDKMLDIMIANKGIGLAAPQAGLPLRLFIVSLDGSRENVKVYVNPTVTTVGELATNEEGCLSVPGIYDGVERSVAIRVRALDVNGAERSIEAEGMLAVCIQHEMDHLLGKVFVEYLSAFKRDRIKARMLKKARDEKSVA